MDTTEHNCVEISGKNLSVPILRFIQARLIRYSLPYHWDTLGKVTDYYGDLANAIKTTLDPSFPTQGNSVGAALAPYLDALSEHCFVMGEVPISVYCSQKTGPLAGYPSNGFYELCRKHGMNISPDSSDDDKIYFVDSLRKRDCYKRFLF